MRSAPRTFPGIIFSATGSYRPNVEGHLGGPALFKETGTQCTDSDFLKSLKL